MFTRSTTARIIRRLSALAAIVALFAGQGFPGTAEAATAAPAFKVTMTSQPTRFVPGTAASSFASSFAYPAYEIHAANVGGASTSGEVTVTATLPQGVTPAAAIGPQLVVATTAGQELGLCSAVGQVVTCATSESVPAGSYVDVNIPVDVSASAPQEVMGEVSVGGGGAATVTRSTTTTVNSTLPAFGFVAGDAGQGISVTNADGTAATQAGSHPYQVTVESGFTTHVAQGAYGSPSDWPVEALKDLSLKMPPGMVVNPQATPVRCTEAQLASTINNGGCPADSQVGSLDILQTSLNGWGSAVVSLYNMEAPPGQPALLGFNLVGTIVHIRGGVSGDFRLGAEADDILAKLAIVGIETQLWGDPSDPSHQDARFGAGCLNGGCPPAVPATTPFLTLPSACSGPLPTAMTIKSWEQPNNAITGSVETSDLNGNPAGVTGCGALAFNPSIKVQPDSGAAASPTGLAVDLHIPQSDGVHSLATANLKTAAVQLPAGMVVNPSAADGLGACSPAEIDLGTTAKATCPDSAKIGTVSIDTPLLDHPLPGAVYLATPHNNPFGSLLAIYIAVADPVSGVVVKLAGEVRADPQTGRLTATFKENPQLPFEDFKLNFFGGPQASLITPPICGEYTTTTDLTPWTSPQGIDARPSDSFRLGSGPDGSSCANSPGEQPNTPSFSAGTVTPLAGLYSPFVLNLRRQDGSQRFSAIDMQLPPGLVGRLAGVPYCPDAALAAAAAKSGEEELASPSCPAASQIGSVDVGAGAGSRPYHVSGTAYLAGPYKGAPLSLAIITPAVAGPFDLGTVVVRTALYVDSETARITARSDALPTILQGIPVDIRSIALNLGRSNFTLNPTNCEAMDVSGSMLSTVGQTAPLSNRFQVGGCKGLDFKPKLKVQLKGATKRLGHPALKAVVTMSPGEANIGRAQVNLPGGEFLDQGNLNKTCTKPVLLAGNCPASSVYGKARAWTPLLDKPLEGDVYLVGGYGYKLPALVADLNGQIRILLVGKVDSGKNKGIRNTFAVVPDAPVSRFVLEMKGGKKYGLLENSENLCKATRAGRRAIVRFTGQNGKVDQYKPVVTNQCRKEKKKKKSGHARASFHAGAFAADGARPGG